jgi:Spy/CpxP family protein refolding chaperone
MKTLIALLAVLVAGLAGFATHQRGELARAAEALSKSASERDLLVARVRELERRVFAPQEVNPSRGSFASGGALAGLGPPPDTPEGAGIAQAIADEQALAAAMLANPKRREAMLGQNRMIARMQHGEIIKRLDLTPEQVDALIEILAQRQLANFGRGGITAGETPAAAEQRIAELDRTENDDIAKLLGPEKAQRFASLRETLMARASLLPVVQDLDLARMPLSPDQHDALAAILHEQTEAMRAQMPVPRSFDPSGSDGAEQLRERAAQTRQWQSELNQKVIEKAATVLAPAQVQRLGGYLQQQLDIEALAWDVQTSPPAMAPASAPEVEPNAPAPN